MPLHENRVPLTDETSWAVSSSELGISLSSSIEAYHPDVFASFGAYAQSSGVMRGLKTFYEKIESRSPAAIRSATDRAIEAFGVFSEDLAGNPLQPAIDSFVHSLTEGRLGNGQYIVKHAVLAPELLPMLLFSIDDNHMIVKPITTGATIAAGPDMFMSVQNIVIGRAETVSRMDLAPDAITQPAGEYEHLIWRDPPIAVLLGAGDEYYHIQFQQILSLGTSMCDGASLDRIVEMRDRKGRLDWQAAGFFGYDERRDLTNPVRVTAKVLSSAAVLAGANQLRM